MICSSSQIDSFWKTVVLSNDCESSMRAMVIEPPRLGVALLEVPWARLDAAPAAAPAARTTSRPTFRMRIRLLLREGGAGSPPSGRPLQPNPRSGTLESEDVVTAVDRQDLAGDPARFLGGEEQHAVRDVLRGAEAAHRDLAQDLLLARGAVRLPLA